MIVTAVERRHGSRARVRIYVDGAPALEMASARAKQRGLLPGRTIDAAELDALRQDEARHDALEAGARLVARRPHSEREIRRKLAQRRYEPALIDQTIARLRSMGAIDDASFARSFAETRHRVSPRSRRMIVSELRSRGVDSAPAVAATEELSDEEAAYRFAEKRLRMLSADEYQAFRERLGAQLRRRGFDWDVVRATVDRCWRESGRSCGEVGIEYAG